MSLSCTICEIFNVYWDSTVTMYCFSQNIDGLTIHFSASKQWHTVMD